jgi:hypothetical protein
VSGVRILLVFLVLGGAIFGLQTALAPGDIAEPLVDIAELGGAPLRSDPAPISDEATGETLDEPGASDAVVLEGGFLPDEIEDRYEWIEFGFLTSFEYPDLVELDAQETPPELPADILELDGVLIAIEGFMNPLSFDREGVKQFALVNDPLNCCFGATPQLNHWIDVTLPEGERTAYYSLDPVAVYGHLEVGEVFEDGFVVSLFRMRADHVIGDF